MAVAGRKPKAEGTAVNRNKVLDWTEVVDVPFEGGPDLDSELLEDEEFWKSSTKAWWAVIRRMPHCTLWSDAAWVDAQLVALTMNRSGAETPEFRMRCKVLGTTGDALRDLRIRYVPPVVEGTENVTQISDYRDL